LTLMSTYSLTQMTYPQVRAICNERMRCAFAHGAVRLEICDSLLVIDAVLIDRDKPEAHYEGRVIMTKRRADRPGCRA
jgi:hypothetical protein